MVPAGIDATRRLATLLGEAGAVMVFTGAGISTASGIPDFRGPEGVWRTRRPVYYSKFMSDDEARRAYWTQKLEDRRTHAGAGPNVVHEAVADLDRAGKVLLVVTQNVDGLHRASGIPRDRLVEVHGCNAEIECQSCGEISDPAKHFDAFEATGDPPICGCGGFLKPATISFGQSLRSDDLFRAFAAADAADLVLSLGTTLLVEPAASIPLAAADRGVPYVVVNRGSTGHDGHSAVTLRIEGDVADVIPAAVQRVLGPQM